MKKENDPVPGAFPAVEEDDDLLSHYDFGGGARGKHAHLFHEGAKVEINGAPFVVKGRTFIPDLAEAPSENGERSRARKRS